MIRVRQAEINDAKVVAQLVSALLCELSDSQDSSPAADAIELTSARLLTDRTCGVWAFLAFNESGAAIGVLTLNQCWAIYAGGEFGKISELYVTQNSRSEGVGQALLTEAIAFARSKGWGRLEVGAPDVPRWSRTVAFYLSNGFIEIGPRLKLNL